MDALNKCVALCRDKPMVFARAITITKDYEILARISDNIDLFNMYYRSKCCKYISLSDALFDLQQDSILIHFADISLYGMFSPTNYTRFCIVAHDWNTASTDNGGIEILTHLYQLVLAGQQQKLVFICTDEAQYSQMRAYAEACFDSKSTQQGKEITVDIVCNGTADITVAYDKLYNYIRREGDETCASTMHHIQLLSYCGHDYRKYSCKDTIDVNTIEALRSVPIDTPTTTYNRDISTQSCTEELAISWIKSNQPMNGISSATYYLKYHDDTKNALTIQKFTKLVQQAGYKKSRNNKGCYWVNE